FSRVPFDAVTRQRWQGCDQSAADCLSLKGFSVARTELASGVCVDVYNLHGEAGDTPHDAELKVENISALIDFIADYSAGRAVIAGGDFNMRLRRETDRIQLERLEAATGLTDACIAQGVVDIAEIDKFYFRPSEQVLITPLTCRFETDVFVDPQGGPLSDHDPLAVRFGWVGVPDESLDCL
ncbi:MAG TPA: hypothetical protein VEB21_09450, partial [Terriglobales bacterium]|nr:hypothetical protein [Terriglobales bacterium]